MKKRICFLVFLLPFLCFAQNFQITNIVYNIEGSNFLALGKTTPYALEQKVSVDKKTIFDSETQLNDYIEEYKIKLSNLRAFESIEVFYKVNSNDETISTTNINEVTLFVNLKDSFHLLALPHVISYNSNEGWKPKLKAKDSNFLGSLNTMSADLYAILPILSDNKNYEIGSEFSFILPFKLSIFEAEWINDYTFSYDFSKPTPEWDTKTGIKLSLPFDNCKLQLELNQYAFRNFEYENYGDSTYFKEELIFSVPITLFKIKNWGTFDYTPYIQAYYNWDKDSINILNDKLSSPTVSVGHQLETSNINWFYNYRKGASILLNNEFYFYLQRHDFVPYICADVKAYYYFKFFESNYLNKLGITTHFNTFCYFNNKSNYYYGKNIGSYLRGIRDDQYFSSNTNFASEKALNTSAALLLNIDLPFHLFTTSFNNKFLSYFNCDAQISPFLDIALCNNLITGRTFNLKDGFYAGGIEVLVYPKKWSSFTVRASLGLDLGRYLFSQKIEQNWRKDVSKYELSIGLGLHY